VAAASGQAGAASGGHHTASKGAWASVYLIIIGFIVGTFALILGNIPLWIIAGVALALGGVMAIASKIMEQAY
jgi:hypothetical protein